MLAQLLKGFHIDRKCSTLSSFHVTFYERVRVKSMLEYDSLPNLEDAGGARSAATRLNLVISFCALTRINALGD